MTGAQMLTMLTQILGGETINQTYALQLINLAKTKYQGMRPWKVLVAVDKTLTVTGSNNYTIPFSVPADFKRYLGESSLAEGSIILFDGNNNVQFLTEVPFEEILNYKDEFGRFAVDYGNGKFYITGVVPGTFTIYQYYIRKTAPITTSTTWERFTDDDYHPILVFDAAARWRLGTDYDDVNARNADDNEKMANAIFEQMASWDSELAISAVNSMDYRNDNWTRDVGPRGTRANN